MIGYGAVKIRSRKSKKERDNEDEANGSDRNLFGGDVEEATSTMPNIASCVELDEDIGVDCIGRGGNLCFQAGHPLSDSHGIRFIENNTHHIPNFLGANLPRCDQGDREYYCSTMLVLFKPWRQGLDLKNKEQTWDTAFHELEFTKQQ